MKGSTTLLLVLSITATPVIADAQRGAQLHDDKCVKCHSERMGFGNNGSDIYTRSDHRVKNLPGLKKQVNLCKEMLGITWFDEDEANVVDYLNTRFYKFPQQ